MVNRWNGGEKSILVPAIVYDFSMPNQINVDVSVKYRMVEQIVTYVPKTFW